MSRNRGTDTSPERHLNELLVAGGAVFTRHERTLPGRPDFVFHDDRVAVFVDGDFWHGWRFPVWQHRLTCFWRDKIAATRERDARNFRRLRRAGWRVVRVWEHQVESDLAGCVRRIAVMVQSVNMLAVADKLATMPPLKRRNRLPRP